MSTTVKYKGNTIATLTSETKSLTTSGTWLEDDIELTDHSVGNIYQDEDGYLVIDDGGDAVLRYTLEEMCKLNNASGDIVFTGTRLKPGLFVKNTAITSFTGNSVTDVKGDYYEMGNNVYTFLKCTNLESVSMPLVTDLYHSDYIFSGCTKLKTANLNYMNMTRLGTGVFQNCSALEKTTFVLPKVTSNVYGNFITNNVNLTAFDIGGLASSVGNFTAGAFTNCSNLNVLIIRDSSIRTLANISVFSGTPFASGKAGGTLYVPSSLISTYEAATNWSTILGYTNNSIQAIEGSIYETKYADGTTISS